MIDAYDVIDTIKMIEEEHLDIRTVTMGISLVDCIRGSIKETADLIYNKITKKAEKLVPTAENISREYGVPIVNKRVSVTPISILGGAVETEDLTPLALAMQRAADTLGIDFIGGFSALVEKGFTKGDLRLINSLPSALGSTRNVCASINVGSSKAGINMDALKLMGQIIKKIAERDFMGCAKLVVFANAVQDNPFMAGAFHGVGEPECVINVGVSGPGVVKSALEKAPEADLTEVSEIIKKTAFKITRMGQLVNSLVSERLGVPSGIVDLSLAPTPAVGDSVARILEEMGLETCGGCGTTACLALLNDAVKKGGVMASSHVGGLSGAFIPVSEDEGMIAAAKSGVLTLEKLEAMTAVCSVGIDMVAVPGDTSAEVISAMIADEIAIGVINTKTTAVRIIPAAGKKVGDEIELGGLLGSAPIMPIKSTSPAKFINRGGLIPAPLHSLKN